MRVGKVVLVPVNKNWTHKEDFETRAHGKAPLIGELAASEAKQTEGSIRCLDNTNAFI